MVQVLFELFQVFFFRHFYNGHLVLVYYCVLRYSETLFCELSIQIPYMTKSKCIYVFQQPVVSWTDVIYIQ